ncbi:glycosyltransferase [Planctomycetaceae bacterium SCGC AG-212-F19]|nr:glycosyltransferase [Planctomycetaceae bacterium SCGC AG-212-F19]
MLLPVSAVIPTRNRPGPLERTLASLAEQSAQPHEIVVIDASDGPETARLCCRPFAALRSSVMYLPARTRGAAAQRNEGIRAASQDVIGFMDDDVILEPGCLDRLWQALAADAALGGVNALIVNQQYLPPSRLTCRLYTLLHGRALASYAGRCIGPAVNLLPGDRPDIPEVVPVDWLNLGCTLYRREALPEPVFDPFFTGYSMFEDLALSLVVGRKWKLASVRTARLFHDSQPSDEKNRVGAMATMELINRHYVMTTVLGRHDLAHYMKLILFESYLLAAALKTRRGRRRFFTLLRGKCRALAQILGWRMRDNS